MGPVTETRVLFIPYRPTSASEQAASRAEISLQKHAAREYHRKAKLSRQGKPKTKDSRRRRQSTGSRKPSQTSSTEDPQLLGKNESPRAPSPMPPCQSLPGTNAFLIKPPTTFCPLPIDVGVGKLDPFNVSIRRDVPRYALEMLDHGKHPRGRSCFAACILRTTFGLDHIQLLVLSLISCSSSNL